MTHTLAALVPLATFACGFLVFHANPQRKANQSVAWGIILVGLWITVRQLSSYHPETVWLFRTCLTVGPLVLAQLILISETLAFQRRIPRSLVSRCLLGAVLVLAVAPWLPGFISSEPGHSRDNNGWGFYLYIIANPLCYLAFFIQGLVRIRKLSGLPKFELQTIALPGVLLGLLISLVMIARTAFPQSVPKESSHILVLAFIAWLSYFLSTHRLFDAQYLFRTAGRYLLVVVGAALVAVVVQTLIQDRLPEGVVYGFAGLLALLGNHLLGRRIQDALVLQPKTEEARTAAYTAARQAHSEEELSLRLSEVVGGWAGAEVSFFFPNSTSLAMSETLPAQLEDPAYRTLTVLKWVTPERLERERKSAERDQLNRHLQSHQWGALVLNPDSITPIVLGVRARGNRRPFTFPEIQQMQEFISLAELAYIRVKLAEQTAQSERLATLGVLGASLAHEIRNPLYGIKSFLELLPGYHNQADSLKQVSDLLTSEITRLQELLSNMVSTVKPPCRTLVDTPINRVVEGSLDLVYHKIRTDDVLLHRELSAVEDRVKTDPSAIKQVILNLCLNAVQAQLETAGKKWIRVATHNTPRGLEISISDNGPGIPPQKRAHLFERFRTTTARGTGLGLAISHELLEKLGTQLELDEYQENHGAVFRIVFPLAVSTSRSLTHAPSPSL
ncbi:MAG TPA: ATP-binding protein [Opitutaceae bacterium]|nr:ATP-binding protein [Opitutaceae bacterium]